MTVKVVVWVDGGDLAGVRRRRPRLGARRRRRRAAARHRRRDRPRRTARSPGCSAAGRRGRDPAAQLDALSRARPRPPCWTRAAARLGRPARIEQRRGRVEREVVAAADGAELLDLRPRRRPQPAGPAQPRAGDPVRRRPRAVPGAARLAGGGAGRRLDPAASATRARNPRPRRTSAELRGTAGRPAARRVQQGALGAGRRPRPPARRRCWRRGRRRPAEPEPASRAAGTRKARWVRPLPSRKGAGR